MAHLNKTPAVEALTPAAMHVRCIRSVAKYSAIIKLSNPTLACHCGLTTVCMKVIFHDHKD